MCHYKHLSTKERECLLILRKIGKTITEIAKELNRSKSTISRELKRNSNEGEYSAYAAAAAYAEYSPSLLFLFSSRLIVDLLRFNSFAISVIVLPIFLNINRHSLSFVLRCL